jgi:hypothetical protein
MDQNGIWRSENELKQQQTQVKPWIVYAGHLEKITDIQLNKVTADKFISASLDKKVKYHLL